MGAQPEVVVSTGGAQAAAPRVGSVAYAHRRRAYGVGPVSADLLREVAARWVRGAVGAVGVIAARVHTQRRLVVVEHEDAAGAGLAARLLAAQPDTAPDAGKAQAGRALSVEVGVALGARRQPAGAQRAARGGDARQVHRLGARQAARAVAVVGAGQEHAHAEPLPVDIHAPSIRPAVPPVGAGAAAIADAVVVEADPASALAIDFAALTEVVLDAAPGRAARARPRDTVHPVVTPERAFGVRRAPPAGAVEADLRLVARRVRPCIARGAAAIEAAGEPHVEGGALGRRSAWPTDPSAVWPDGADRARALGVASDARGLAADDAPPALAEPRPIDGLTLIVPGARSAGVFDAVARADRRVGVVAASAVARITAAAAPIHAQIAIPGPQDALGVFPARVAGRIAQRADGRRAVLCAAGMISGIAAHTALLEALDPPERRQGGVLAAEGVIVVPASHARALVAGPDARTARAVHIARALGTRRPLRLAAEPPVIEAPIGQ